MKKLASIPAFFLLLLFYSCKKSSIEESPITWELKGSVLLFDEGNSAVDKSGMEVSIENSNPVISTTTNASGDFVLKVDAALESFALVYSKPQFGTFKRYFTKSASDDLYELDWDNVKHKTDGTWASLGSKSTVTINSLNASIVGDKLRLTFNVISPKVNGEKYARFLFQKNLPGISINTVDKTRANWSVVWSVKNGENIMDLCLKCSAICDDWAKGDTIYMTAYGDSYYSNMYFDRSANALILPNLNLNSNLTSVAVVLP